MTANTPIDRTLKNGLLDDTLTVINIQKLYISLSYRLTGEEQQIGGFDLIYRNSKRIKNGLRNLSFLGCLNNRHQQMRKMAKAVALRLAEKAKEDKVKQKSKDEKRDNRNVRNRSINAPQAQFRPPNSNTAIINKTGTNIRKV